MVRRVAILLSFFAGVWMLAQTPTPGGGVPQDPLPGRSDQSPSLVPIHPGQPGVRPFWNRFSRRFMYPPAFAFEEVDGAERYRFTALSLPDSGLYTFEADRPWVPLTPFWTDLPYSDVQLTVEAIGLSEQDTAVLAGTRGFVKSPPFSGPYGEPAYDYGESGRRCLADLLAQPKLQYWMTVNEPDPSYPLWVHPSKMVRGIVRGMVAYSRVDPRPEDADQALEVAKRAARFLLSLSEPQGAPLAAWPPTFWDGVDGDIHPVYAGEHMSLEPAEVAQAYLDLFDATGDSLYLRAVREIAKTYVRLQREDGTWYQLIETATGGPVKEHLLVPVSVINLFDRLARQYGTSDYRQARTSALEWCMNHPVRTFSWEAQYEDTRPRERYKNLSHREPLMLATLLLGEHPMDPEMVAVAEELIRFAEDQFVVWEITDPITRAPLFRPGSRWNGNDPYFGSDWFVPSAAEQYVFFTPISAATSFFIDAYVAAFTTTGKRTYLAKAVSLANTITIAQRYWGGREIPTHLRKTMPELNWINVSVKAATSLIRHRDVLTAFYGR